MLQAIKERAQGWVAWAIVILISVPFAFWGIDSYLGGGAEPVVAKVDGTKITERALDRNVDRSRMQLRERLGAAYNPDLFEGMDLRAQVLDRMIRDTVLMDASLDMGLRVSDEAVRAAILAEPAFLADGRFDKNTYERVLRLQGLTPSAYEEQLRRGLLSTQLPRAVSDSAFVTDAEVDAATRLLRQRRDLAYVLLPAGDFAPNEDPSDAEVQAFYDQNPDRFVAPERVRISYLLLDAEQLSTESAAPDEASLRAAYDARVDEFMEPERREIRHILLQVPADADADTADGIKAELMGIREQVESGADFADVAAEHSEDPGSAAQGGDLGMVGRGIMDPAFEQAAFELEQGRVSEPVRSRFGYHLIEVTAVEGGEPRPFDEVRDQLAAELGSGEAEAAYFELAEQLANLTYEAPDSLIPAAEALGLEVQTSDWITRDGAGGEGPLAPTRVIAAAFSEDVLVRGNNSELLEPDADRMQAIVLRVDEHEPAAGRPLEEVRDEIVQVLQEQASAEAALAAADAMGSRLGAGEGLEVVAGDYEVQRPGFITRNDAEVPPTALELAFRAPRPSEGEPTSVTGQLPGGDAVMVTVLGVEDGEPDDLDAAVRDAERRMLARSLGDHGFEAVLDDLVARAKIERRALSTDEDTP